MTNYNVGAIITCAGLSTRMEENKALLNWNGLPLLEQQILLLSDSGIQYIVVVLGHEIEKLQFIFNKYPNLNIVTNKEYIIGRSSSIKIGLSAIANYVDNVLILGVDQPRPLYTIELLLNDHLNSNSLITYPTYNNKGGHPIIFNKETFVDIKSISEESNGLRFVINKYNKILNKIEINDPRVILDLNTKSNYLEALKLFNLPDSL